MVEERKRLPRYIKKSKTIIKALKNNLYIHLSVMVVLSILAINCIRRLTVVEKTRRDFEFIYRAMEEDLKNIVLENKGTGCSIPKLDPFDEKVLMNENKFPPGVCQGKDWVECIFDKCSVAKTVQDDLKNVICEYRDVLYDGNATQHLGPPRVLHDGQIYRLRNSDFVHVACVGINRLHPGPQFKWSGYKAGLRHVHLRKRTTRGPHLNVAMLCFGAMSRNGFIRKMPESHAALENIGAFILNGYNIVGGGTSGALIPIFVGKEIDVRQSPEFFDAEDCFFQQLFNMGYRTAYFGDSPVHGSFEATFNFTQSLPTDHHLLPLLYSVYGKTRANTRNFCFGDMPLYRFLLNLTHQFTTLNGPRFSFTLITDVNHDHFNMASAVDTDLASFLHGFHNSRNRKNTMLFVMGAHGTSFSSPREVSQLTMEDRLPLMAIVLPERLKQNRPDAAAALAANVEVLTTPFDVRATLTDVLEVGDNKDPFKVPGADVERGLTLLRPHYLLKTFDCYYFLIPASRSCGEAGVTPHWCACATWEPLERRDPLHKEIGILLANYINDVTTRFKKYCLPRELNTIQRVQRLLPNKKNGDKEHLLKIDQWVVPRSKYYKATVILNPGEAVFEATLRYYSKLDYFAVAEQDISRLTSYANESACLPPQHQALQKFCYCRY